MKSTILLVVLFLSSHLIHAQESEHEEGHEFKHHRLALGLGNSHIPNGSSPAGGSFKLFIPTWSIEYDYSFNHNWTIGLHTDLEFMTYIVEAHDGAELEREYPLMVSLIGARRIKEGLVLFTGPGIEFEKHKNLWVYQLGLAYEFELPGHWDITPSYVYTTKEDIYDTWTFLVSVGKHF